MDLDSLFGQKYEDRLGLWETFPTRRKKNMLNMLSSIDNVHPVSQVTTEGLSPVDLNLDGWLELFARMPSLLGDIVNEATEAQRLTQGQGLTRRGGWLPQGQGLTLWRLEEVEFFKLLAINNYNVIFQILKSDSKILLNIFTLAHSGWTPVFEQLAEAGFFEQIASPENKRAMADILCEQPEILKFIMNICANRNDDSLAIYTKKVFSCLIRYDLCEYLLTSYEDVDETPVDIYQEMRFFILSMLDQSYFRLGAEHTNLVHLHSWVFRLIDKYWETINSRLGTQEEEKAEHLIDVFKAKCYLLGLSKKPETVRSNYTSVAAAKKGEKYYLFLSNQDDSCIYLRRAEPFF